MPEQKTYTFAELVEMQQAVTKEVAELIGPLDGTQLNWKPAAEVWSAGQILDHLITTNTGYFDSMERLATGKAKSSVWQKLPVLPGLAGRFVKNAVDPDNVRKIKAPGKFQPTLSEISPDIVEGFQKAQERLLELMEQTKGLSLETTIISSPIAKFICYSLRDAFTIMALHNRRHLDQAKRLLASPAFPSPQSTESAVAAGVS